MAKAQVPKNIIDKFILAGGRAKIIKAIGAKSGNAPMYLPFPKSNLSLLNNNKAKPTPIKELVISRMSE